MTLTVSFLSLSCATLHPSGGWFPAHPGVHMTVALILTAWTAASVPVALVLGRIVHNADVRELESVS